MLRQYISAAVCAISAQNMAKQQKAYNLYRYYSHKHGDAFVGVRGKSPIVSGRTNIPAVSRN